MYLHLSNEADSLGSATEGDSFGVGGGWMAVEEKEGFDPCTKLMRAAAWEEDPE